MFLPLVCFTDAKIISPRCCTIEFKLVPKTPGGSFKMACQVRQGGMSLVALGAAVANATDAGIMVNTGATAPTHADISGVNPAGSATLSRTCFVAAKAQALTRKSLAVSAAPPTSRQPEMRLVQLLCVIGPTNLINSARHTANDVQPKVIAVAQKNWAQCPTDQGSHPLLTENAQTLESAPIEQDHFLPNRTAHSAA
jgi:hypothetical protein